MIGWMFLPLRRMRDFSGRSRRREFWWFMVLQLIVFFLAVSASISLPVIRERPAALVWFLIVHALVFAWPTLGVMVRRMHDQDRSGWWLTPGGIPYIGLGFLLYHMVYPGTWGPNRYGDDPRQTWEGDLFE